MIRIKLWDAPKFLELAVEMGLLLPLRDGVSMDNRTRKIVVGASEA
jgi:hypothetical protein